MTRPRPHIPRCRAYTLLELLMVIVILGIAGALVIPAMGETGVIKVQGALRAIVADMTFAQSDAVAFQEKRAIIFDVATSSYTLVAVPGNSVDATTNTLYDPTRRDGRYITDFRDNRFGDARIISSDFGAGSNTLIFDAMGGPLASAGSNNPGQGGIVRVRGSGTTWIIQVEAFTGRITVAQEQAGNSDDFARACSRAGTLRMLRYGRNAMNNKALAKAMRERCLRVTAFGCVLLAFGLLLWARFIIVTGHPRTAVAEPRQTQEKSLNEAQSPRGEQR